MSHIKLKSVLFVFGFLMVTKKKGRNWNLTVMPSAFKAVRNTEMELVITSKLFNVP